MLIVWVTNSIVQVPFGFQAGHQVVLGTSEVLGQTTQTMGTSAECVLLRVGHAAAAATNTTGIAARAFVAELAWGCKIKGCECA